MRWPPVLIITLAYLLCVFTLLILMGMEIIVNRQVVDRLLITIPITGALIGAYWFVKKKNGNSK